MRVNGQGNAGFMQGEGTLDLEEQNGNTLLKYRGETHVGGCDDLMALDSRGGLKPLLEGAA